MQTIVVAAAKGGVGKTTLSAYLSVEAARHHAKVAVMDLDPIGSLTGWYGLRSKSKTENNPRLIEPGKDFRRAIEKARKQKYEILIIDTAPGSLTRIQTAIEIADFVLIPMRPSPIDVRTVDLSLGLCASQRRPSAIALNSTTPRSAMSEGARTFLEARGGKVLTAEIAARASYMHAMLSGSTPAELNPKGPESEEIAQLWRELCDRAISKVSLKPAQFSKSD